MREHGVLRRVLLTYDGFVRRLDSKEKKEKIDPKVLVSATDIVKKFIEGY